jgi:hypothetical protein
MSSKGGRPKSKLYPRRVYTRLDSETALALAKYCEFHRVTKSEALREASESYFSAIAQEFRAAKNPCD